jgi:hypothetical protein
MDPEASTSADALIIVVAALALCAYLWISAASAYRNWRGREGIEKDRLD